jgi:hypothetical protein
MRLLRMSLDSHRPAAAAAAAERPFVRAGGRLAEGVVRRRGVMEALGSWGIEGRDGLRGRIARGGAWARAAGRRTAAAARAACWCVLTLPAVAAAGGWRVWLRLLNRVARELVRLSVLVRVCVASGSHRELISATVPLARMRLGASREA